MTTYLETVHLEGVRVTIEGVKTNVADLGEVLIKSQARVEDRLNAVFNLFQDSKDPGVRGYSLDCIY